MTTLHRVFLLSLFFSTGTSSLARNILPSPCISSAIISITRQIQKRSMSGCLLALRTPVTFTHNPRANSTATFNHLGGEEFLVSLNLKAMLQLIIISPLAFTKATKMRQQTNQKWGLLSGWRASPFKLIANGVKHRIFTFFAWR